MNIRQEMKNKNMLKSHIHYAIALESLVKIKKNAKLLEVGAGGCILKSLLPKNISYSSVDMFGSPTYKIDLNHKKIPEKDNTFDILVCLETLEHTLYPEKILQELKRVTKKSGLFILSMPNEYNLWLRLNYLFGIKKYQTDSPFEVVSKLQHIHRPRVMDIISLFGKHFEIEKIHYLWQSKLGYQSDFFYNVDKLIDFLAKVYPNLFARIVLIEGKPKL